MSRRFGRNQRRRLQAQVHTASELAIAAIKRLDVEVTANAKLVVQLGETQRALTAELGSEFRVATGEELWVIPEANVRRFTDTTEHRRADRMYEIERTADVDVIEFQRTEALMEAMSDRWRRRELVSFRGIRWAIDQIEANRPESFSDRYALGASGGFQFTVRLVALGRRKA